MTQVFGIRGWCGDLLIAPQLMPSKYDAKGRAEMEMNFAGSRTRIVILNPRRLKPGLADIVAVRSSHGELPFKRLAQGEIVIDRGEMAKNKISRIEVELG